MKSTTALVFVALAISACFAEISDEAKQRARKYSKECQEETGLSDEVIQKVRSGEEVDDPKIVDHTFCFMKKIGFVNSEGELQFDTIKAKITDFGTGTAIEESIDKCKEEKGADKKETAYKFFRCYMKEAKGRASY